MMIAASLMCADFWRLGEHIGEMEAAGVDMLHFDVMDAHFVPNLGIGPQVFASVRRGSRLPSDVHLMVSEPAAVIPLYAGADWILIHAESDRSNLRGLLERIADQGARPGLALNPGTRADVLEWVIDQVQMVLVMTVDPGFAGRPFIPAMVAKVSNVRALLDANGRSDALICVDGNIHAGTVPGLAAAGANVLVGGSSGLFRRDASLAQAVQELRTAARTLPPRPAQEDGP
jgi:ribulose-phosphate 3-epimerase